MARRSARYVADLAERRSMRSIDRASKDVLALRYVADLAERRSMRSIDRASKDVLALHHAPAETENTV